MSCKYSQSGEWDVQSGISKDQTALKKSFNWELINLLITVIFEPLYGNHKSLFARNSNQVITGCNAIALQMESQTCEAG